MQPPRRRRDCFARSRRLSLRLRERLLPARANAALSESSPFAPVSGCHPIRSAAYTTPGSATDWTLIATLSLGQVKQQCHVNKPADDRNSSNSSVSLSTARVPARSRTQKSGSSTTGARLAPASHGSASVSPPARRLLLRFVA